MSVTLFDSPEMVNSDASPTIELRPYQKESVEAVLTKNAEGVKRQLGVAATGTGKTVIFAELARQMNVSTLILAHRDELINQAVEKIRMVWPNADIGVVKAERDEHNHQITVASVQSLSKQNRLNRLYQDKYKLIICDEAHHITAITYCNILDHFGQGPNNRSDDGPLLLGVTATPDRGDKQGLIKVLDEIVFNYDMRWGITNGYLCDLVAKQVLLKLDLDNVKKSHGDYQDGALGEALQAADAPQHIVEAWKTHASDRKTLVFTPTVELAISVSNEFLQHGIAANWVSGTTPIEERRQIFADVKSGKIQVLTNCAIMTEGYDEPSVDCIVMARPTKSRSLYAQVIGRGSRKFPLKKNCLILDVTGVSKKHSLTTVASLLGIPEKALDKGGSAKQAIGEQVAAQTPRRDPVTGLLVTEDVDLWEQFDAAEFAWVQTERGFALSLMGGTTVMLQRMGTDWGVAIYRRDQDGNESRSRLKQTVQGIAIELAQGIAEDFCRAEMNRTGGSSTAFLSKAAPWRQALATEKQKEALIKWKVPFDGKTLTKGEAAELLTAKIASKSFK